MISRKFLMGRGREQLSISERKMIESSISSVFEIAARKPLVRHGESLDKSMLLLEGFVCRYKKDMTGARQAVEFHVPGDFLDLHGFGLKRLDHDIETISEAKVATFNHDVLTIITEQWPNLSKSLWFSTLLDASMHRKWIFSHGRLRAEGRIANFLCEIYVRLDMVGLVTDGAFHFPLTQPDLGEITGLTGVHVNRVLRSLRSQGFFAADRRSIRILDYEGLARLGEFNADYLLPPSTSAKRAP